MCLIAFAWRYDARYELVVAANRDEFHARPTAAAHWWQDPTGLFAGADLQAGGAWCGMDRAGRFAAVTNVRETQPVAGRRSRGQLVRNYFAHDGDARSWADFTRDNGEAFGPFNLLVGDRESLWFTSNRGSLRHKRLEPGVHAISNGRWGDHWPKTERARTRLAARLDAGDAAPASLFQLLSDTDTAPAADLPDTGVGPMRERFLSPLFVRSAAYGTRASTVIKRTCAGAVDFHERGFDADANPQHEVEEHWHLDVDEHA